jgi:phage shock protein A
MTIATRFTAGCWVTFAGEYKMNLKDRLGLVFKETFLDLFKDEQPNPESLGDAVLQARNDMEQATDALAAYMVNHLHLKEDAARKQAQLDALNQKLETAMAEKDDAQARCLIRDRMTCEQDAAAFTQRVEASEQQLAQLKERLNVMKARVLEIEHKKIELEMRDRAAESIQQFDQAQNGIDRSHHNASAPGTEEHTLFKEHANQVAEEQRTTLDTKLDDLLEDDLVEQELNRLKQQRNEA